MRAEQAKTIKYIHIFGMRDSGTNHLMKTLQLNLPKGCGITVNHNVLGWKHDDIWSPSGFTDEKNSRIIFDERPSPSTIYESLVFVIYRNPISWVQSLHLLPHQAPELFKLNFSDFIRHSFRTFYTPVGKDIPENEESIRSIVRADRLWDRYPDIYKMRNVKISLFESFKYRAPNVCYVNLETLNEHPRELLDCVSSHYRIPIKKNFSIDTKDKHGESAYVPKKYAEVSKDDFIHIINNLNMRKERYIGYHLRAACTPIKIGKLNKALLTPPHVASAFTTTHAVRMFSYEWGDCTREVTHTPK
jgi:hypothetical protein